MNENSGCSNCEYAELKEWSKGQAAYRCKHPECGAWWGRITSNPAPTESLKAAKDVPAWCPRGGRHA